jgi:hypothetical protein
VIGAKLHREPKTIKARLLSFLPPEVNPARSMLVPQVERRLDAAVSSPDQLALNPEQEKENITTFVEQSRRFFEEFAAQEDLGSESIRITRLLPKKEL